MYLSLNWLLEYTPYAGSTQELKNALTNLGLEVDEEFVPFSHLEAIFAGRIIECAPHPETDSLRVCHLDLGNKGTFSVVCGDTVCHAGQMVPVALAGSELASGYVVERNKIRGQSSEGMICSERELGLGEDGSGIMLLDSSLSPGINLLDGLNLRDRIFDIDLTPNRGDCLSILGIAREVASCFGLPLAPPHTGVEEEGRECPSRVNVRIHDDLACPLYQARVAEGVTAGRSPDWMRYRLLSMGLRPINTVVDVTNYVMLETGQPLHAFDLERLSGNTIHVARSGQEREITTLNGQSHCLDPEDLLIWDEEKPIAIAGIMGCKAPEVGPYTSGILLECAVFDPTTVRRTSRRLGLGSESSHRFERGVDQVGSRTAINRAAHLIQRLAGGSLLQGISLSEPRPWQPPRIHFRPEKARRLLAMDAEDSFCLSTLQSLGCSVRSSHAQDWEVTPPSHRLDLSREVDLVEEVGRFYGLESTPETMPRILPGTQARDPEKADYDFQNRIREWAKGQGLNEVMNYSFVSSRDCDALGLPRKNRLELYNPLTTEQDTMRPVLAPGLLLALRLNLDRHTEDLHLFEIARAFELDPGISTSSRETTRLGIVLHGRRHPRFWPWPAETSHFQDLKGTLENLFSSLHLQQADYSREMDHPFLDLCASIWLHNSFLGTAGRLMPELGKKYHAKHAIWIAELDLDILQKLYRRTIVSYTPWSKFPPVLRDITLVAEPDLAFDNIRKAVTSAEIPILDSYHLLDIYHPPDSLKRNITLRVVYRHPERTLTDREVDEEHGKLGDHLLRNLPVHFP